MSRTPGPSRRRAGGLAAVVGTAAGVTVAMAPSAAGVPVAETVKIGTATSLSVMSRGNGHGHGMSEYGARGAARVGLDYKRIVAFYYPGASLVSTPRRMIRVKLDRTGSTTTIAARTSTTVTGVSGYLAVTGIRRYRLLADAKAGLSLQRLASAAGAK